MGDVNTLTKEEFLKFLNCSVTSRRQKTSEQVIIAGPKKSIFTIKKCYGTFRAKEVTINEASFNNKVLRISLPRVDLQALDSKKIAALFKRPKRIVKRFSRFGRKIIRKRFLYEENKSTNTVFHKPKKYQYKESNKNQLIHKVKVGQQNIYNKLKRKMKPIDQRDSVRKYINTTSYHKPLYYLAFTYAKYPEDGKLNYSFEALVVDVKNMKLPSANWKIKVVIRKNKISSIVFTNKCEPERSVTFTAKSSHFSIVIDNKPALLLGSPPTVNSVEDIEVLLNIVHTISPRSSMILYK